MSSNYDILNRPPVFKSDNDALIEIDQDEKWKGEHLISIANGIGKHDERSGRARFDRD